MTDHEEERPLTRRERRLQQMADTGLTPVITAEVAAGSTEPEGADAEGEIFIAPVDEHGRTRTRREIRELREAALAEREASAVQAEEAEASAESGVDDAVTEAIPGQKAAEPAVASGAEASTPGASEAQVEAAAEADDLDSRLAETQAFDLQDLVEATADSSDDVAPAAVSFEDEETVEAPSESQDISAVFEDEADIDFVAGVAAGDAATEAIPAATQGYTFPDIAPLEENISVFDDPAVRTVSPGAPAKKQSEESGFDDLISRAVAQEGAASATNTSALILPAMPEGSDLSGPIGETGELFITGSIELPRSLGETGGHSALLDSVEGDPLDELGFAERQAVADASIAPVSAARAVSARAVPGPVVTEAQKEKSKLPLVLIATGGGLVVAVAALLVWGATSGMFG